MSEQPFLSVSGLRAGYGAGQVLHGIDLDVARGEIFALLGPNGAGKTTTIRCLLGLVRPSSGRCALLGAQRHVELAGVIGRVGSIVETPALYPRFSGRRNLELLGRISAAFNLGPPVQVLPGVDKRNPRSLHLLLGQQVHADTDCIHGRQRQGSARGLGRELVHMLAIRCPCGVELALPVDGVCQSICIHPEPLLAKPLVTRSPVVLGCEVLSVPSTLGGRAQRGANAGESHYDCARRRHPLPSHGQNLPYAGWRAQTHSLALRAAATDPARRERGTHPRGPSPRERWLGVRAAGASP
jgi:energy-coupling factor transporter ATP-binding protein EcfA2